MPLAYPPLLYLLARMLWIGFRGRREGLRPTLADRVARVAALFLIGFRVDAQHRRLRGDRRRLRRRDRRRPDHPRRTDLRQLPRRQPRSATPTARSTTTPTCRSSWRCPGRRAGTTCPPPTARRSSSTWRPSAGLFLLGRRAAAGPPPGRDASAISRLRLGRLPVHRLRAAVELQRLAGRRAARLVAGPVRPAGGARARCSRWRRWPSSRRWRSCRCSLAGDRGLLADRAPSAAAAAARLRPWLVLACLRRRRRADARPPGDRPGPRRPSATARSPARSTAPRRSASGARCDWLQWLQTAMLARRRPCSRSSLAFVPRRRIAAPGRGARARRC